MTIGNVAFGCFHLFIRDTTPKPSRPSQNCRQEAANRRPWRIQQRLLEFFSSQTTYIDDDVGKYGKASVHLNLPPYPTSTGHIVRPVSLLQETLAVGKAIAYDTLKPPHDQQW